MLPILRIISVGGVFLAIAILSLALIPPGGSQLVMGAREAGPRGPLTDGKHPEWQQFLLQAALRRLGELERLRSLTDTVIHVPPSGIPADDQPAVSEKAPEIAGLPVIIDHAVSDDITGSIDDNPDATLTIEIGETSSTELPVLPVDERPPVLGVPALQTPVIGPQSALSPELGAHAQAKAAEAPRRAVQKRPRRKPAARPAPPAPAAQVPPPFNLLAMIFGGLANASAAGNTAGATRSHVTPAPADTPHHQPRTPAVLP